MNSATYYIDANASISFSGVSSPSIDNYKCIGICGVDPGNIDVKLEGFYLGNDLKAYVRLRNDTSHKISNTLTVFFLYTLVIE